MTMPENYGKIFRSKPETFSDGNMTDFDLRFLEPAMKRYKAPVLTDLYVHFDGSLSGVTATLIGEDKYKIVEQIILRDAGGVFVDLGGSQVRIIDQIENGDTQIDPGTIASGATDTAADVWLRINFRPQKSHRPSDTAITLNRLIDGGEISVRHNVPPGGVVNSGQFRIYAVIVEDRVREVKSRMHMKQRTISATEDDYSVDGSLRLGYISSDTPDTAGYSSVAPSVVATVDSKTLDFPSGLDTTILKLMYLSNQRGLAAGDEVIDENVIPLVWPREFQKIAAMPDLRSLHLEVSATVTAMRLVLVTIQDRNAALAANWMGFSSIGAYVAAMKTVAMVKAKGSGNKKTTAWRASLVRRLPVRFQ